MKRLTAFSILILLFSLSFREVSSDGGELDAGFGTGGKMTTNIAGIADEAHALAIQPDGKIVLAGSAAISSTRGDVALSRYNSNGSLDTSFGNSGKVTGVGGQARAVTIQPDGKIVVAGIVGGNFAIVRYNSDGSLDTGFGTAGIATPVFSGGFAMAVALQPDGKIVAAGHGFVTARFNSDGSRDMGFGSFGFVSTSFGPGMHLANAMAIQPDGKIIVAGTASVSPFPNRAFALARYNSDGSLDTTFDGDGLVTTFLSSRFPHNNEIFSIAIDSNGRIIAAGNASNDTATSFNFGLARYNADGSLDTSFGAEGKVNTDLFGQDEQLLGIALQTDGKIVAAGFNWFSGNFASSNFAIARYESNGSLDPSFGILGKVTTDFFNFFDRAMAVAIQPDGDIIAAGLASIPGDNEFALARYLAGPTGFFPASESFAASGGTGTVNVILPSGTAWTATSNDGFIGITSGGSGTGTGTVIYSVAENLSPAIRNGTIEIAGEVFTVLQGAAFADVPPNHPFYREIGKLSARSVTLGCDPMNYCPDLVVTRDQMAAFIIRALGDLNPPQPATQRFADVPSTNPFYAFIEQLAIRQITLGCGGGNYCPSDPVLRDQMAAFIIRALGEFNPPLPPSQRFLDVPPTNFFYRFIDRMAILQITLGCGGGNYCPSMAVTRGQMAAFLVRAFDL